MRYFLLGFALCCVLVVSLAGFRGSMSRKPPIEVFPDMDRQQKVRPEEPSAFFADGRGSRMPVAHTVSRSANWELGPATTGMEAGTTNFVALSPIPLTAKLMARGQERFAIYCKPCHGPQADGMGITKKYGMAVVANLHDKRIVEMPDGELFYVITNGRNLMQPYGPQVTPEDRWAIIAYLRALQLSHLGAAEDLPADMRAGLK